MSCLLWMLPTVLGTPIPLVDTKLAYLWLWFKWKKKKNVCNCSSLCSLPLVSLPFNILHQKLFDPQFKLTICVLYAGVESVYEWKGEVKFHQHILETKHTWFNMVLELPTFCLNFSVFFPPILITDTNGFWGTAHNQDQGVSLGCFDRACEKESWIRVSVSLIANFFVK